MKGVMLLAATLVITALIGSRDLIGALKKNALLNAHDMSAYAIYLTEFHSNIKAANFVPVWAESLQHGFGEPHLQYRPPLQLYLTELLYLVTGNSFTALNVTILAFIALATLGMYLLIEKLLKLLRVRDALWAAALGAAGYALSPYFLRNIYVRGALSEISSQAVLPFVALAFIHLAQAPNSKRTALAALAYGALAVSHASIQLIATPFLFLVPLVFKVRARVLAYFAGATALGAAASSFYWAAALLEKKHLKLALITVGPDAYSNHFAPLHELLLSMGLLALLGLAIALFRLAREIPLRRLSLAQYRACIALVCSIGACVFFSHRTSAVFYEWLPYLQIMSFPWRWLALLVFFAAPLGVLALALETANRWIWGALLLAIFALGHAQARAKSYLDYKPDDFSSNNISALGWGWPTNAVTPATAPVAPSRGSAELLEFKQGRGELACERRSPTKIRCDVMAIQAATLKLNILDYPRWEATVDGKAAATGRDLVSGTPLVSVSPGKHRVEWQLRHTTARLATRAISAVALLLALGLLFQDQIRKTKARAPKDA